MGYKFSDKKINCPLFHHGISTVDGKIFAVDCNWTDTRNLGFNVRTLVTFKDQDSMKSYTDAVCSGQYECCVFYKRATEERLMKQNKTKRQQNIWKGVVPK